MHPFVMLRTCLSIVSPFCERSLVANKLEEYYNINAAGFSTDVRDPRDHFEAIDQKSTKIYESGQMGRINIHGRGGGISVRGARQKLVSRPNSKFSISTRISCFRRLPGLIRRFWHFQNALPRARFRNVYCKILLPPAHPPTRTNTHTILYNVTRCTTLLHETGTMHFTTPYAARTALRSRPFFRFYSQWFFSLRVTGINMIKIKINSLLHEVGDTKENVFYVFCACNKK